VPQALSQRTLSFLLEPGSSGHRKD